MGHLNTHRDKTFSFTSSLSRSNSLINKMSPATCFYEVGIKTKHVKLAFKIPDLRSSKITIRKKMKQSRGLIKKRKFKAKRYADTSSLSSINVDWRLEFEEKYRELLKKTQNKKHPDCQPSSVSMKSKFQEEMKEISLLAATSLLNDSDEKLDLSFKESILSNTENNNSVLETSHTRKLLSPKKKISTRNLKYSYHILRKNS